MRCLFIRVSIYMQQQQWFVRIYMHLLNIASVFYLWCLCRRFWKILMVWSYDRVVRRTSLFLCWLERSCVRVRGWHLSGERIVCRVESNETKDDMEEGIFMITLGIVDLDVRASLVRILKHCRELGGGEIFDQKWITKQIVFWLFVCFFSLFKYTHTETQSQN